MDKETFDYIVVNQRLWQAIYYENVKREKNERNDYMKRHNQSTRDKLKADPVSDPVFK